MNDRVREVLGRSAFFSSLGEEAKAAVLEGARMETFESGSYLCRIGAPATAMYVLAEGRVAVELGSRSAHGVASIEVLAEGDTVGWSWLLEPFEWRLDARAVGDATVVRIDSGHLLACCDRSPRIGFELMRGIAKLAAHRLIAVRERAAQRREPVVCDG